MPSSQGENVHVMYVSSHLNGLLTDVLTAGEKREGSSSRITQVTERSGAKGNSPPMFLVLQGALSTDFLKLTSFLRELDSYLVI